MTATKPGSSSMRSRIWLQCSDTRRLPEGIETEEQLTDLKQTSCNAVQGFYFFRPMPVEDFEHQAESESDAVKVAKD
ncbi:MAG: hypothetical protein V8R49_09105 [Duodenibacillus massiliensis]